MAHNRGEVGLGGVCVCGGGGDSRRAQVMHVMNCRVV